MTARERGITKLGSVRTFMKVGTCSETLFNVVDRGFGSPMVKEEHASMPFAGGIMQHGYQCGQVWGAAFGAGAQAYRLHGAGPRAEAAALEASQRMVETFRAREGNINCFEITQTDLRSKWESVKFFLLKGGSIGCFRMAGRNGPALFEVIEESLSAEPASVPEPPVSCAAELARRRGGSEMHVVMAAGLAGGIGLSGGACGALGVAIWMTAMRCIDEGVGKDVWSSDVFRERCQKVLDSFLGSSDHTFECSEIVGRRFESVADHASHLRDGGCSKILDALTV